MGLAFRTKYVLAEAPPNLTLYFWGIYEMGFPEGPNVKAPGEF